MRTVENEVTNKRLGRRAVYMTNGEVQEVHLFNRQDFVGVVDRAEAHKWIHGQEDRESPPEIAPTVDEMIEAIGDKLKAEMEAFMDLALSHPDNLQRAYQSARSKNERLMKVWMA